MIITTTMSDYEDDLDDDLPSVSLSQSHDKSELEMPSASEIASQRAREEAAERALMDLQKADIAPCYVSLSRSASQGSSGEEGEVNSFFMANEDTDQLAALSAAVSALQVTEPQPAGHDFRTERLELVTAMRDRLPAGDTQLLDAYIRVLKERPEAVDTVTEKILCTISAALITGWGGCVCGACAWLLCVSLTATKTLRVRRALHALLDNHASSEDVEVIRKACVALQDGAEQLLSAHDAVRTGTGRGADRLANSLLAQAMAAVLPTEDQEMRPIDIDPPAPLSADNITSIRSSWRKMSPRSQLTLLRCAGRALAARGEREKKGEMGGEREGGAALLDALAQPLPRASAFHDDRQQVLTNLSKLQLLFRSRFSPDPELDDILDNSQGSISELTDIPIGETPLTVETRLKVETPLLGDTPLTGETIITEVTTMTRVTTTSGETITTEESSVTRDSSMSRDTPISVETHMSVDTEISSHGSTSEKVETPVTDTNMTIETRRETPIKETAISKTSKETPKKKTQTKLDRFMRKEAPMKTETETKTEVTRVENKKEIEDNLRSPERKRSRRERHERRWKKGQK